MTQAIEIGNTAAAIAMSPHDEFVAKIDYTVDRAQRALLDLQKPEGYWHAPLEANAEMNAEFIIFNHFMDTVDVETEARLKKHLLDTQSSDGSWALYQGGEGYLSTTIESLFCAEAHRHARRRRADGGRAALDSVEGRHRELRDARALLPGVDGTDHVGRDGGAAGRALAFPELVPVQHLRAWFMGARNADGIDDAAGGAARKKDRLPARRARALHRAAAFHEVQTAAREKIVFAAQRAELRRQGAALLRSAQNKSLRARALRHTEEWLLEHQEANGSWGGIEPCYLLSAMALKANGYRNDHPVLKRAIEASQELIWHFDDYDMYMPCVSVNWDTGLAGRALLDSGLPGDHPALKQTSQWLIDHQIFKKGDWSVKRPEPRAGRMGVRVLQRLTIPTWTTRR